MPAWMDVGVAQKLSIDNNPEQLWGEAPPPPRASVLRCSREGVVVVIVSDEARVVRIVAANTAPPPRGKGATGRYPPPPGRARRLFLAGCREVLGEGRREVVHYQLWLPPPPPPRWCRPLGILGVIEEGPMGCLQQFVFPPSTSLAGGGDASSVISGEKGGRHRRRRGPGCVPHRGGRDHRGHRVVHVPRGPSPVPIPHRSVNFCFTSVSLSTNAPHQRQRLPSNMHLTGEETRR